MSNVVITAEGIGKSYMIGHQQQESYSTLRDSLSRFPKRLWSRLRNPQYHIHNDIEEFWALEDINFEIKQGDRVGIIGRNGAGKSTLLKILSRITEPTTGRLTITGRVASLLEVGTGFHPELTGRENIFLNGAILGMSRFEVKKKFDEIVDFAAVVKFLDTPVKRYSSGMYVRLAFAVAAHLEPEILIIDEVLAVGDISFQKKCLNKMENVAQEGRTVIFVSHNMGAITNLCTRAIHIHNGTITEDGSSQKIVANYINSVATRTSETYLNEEEPSLPAWIMSANLTKKDGQKSASFLMTESFKLECIVIVTVESQLTLSLQIKELNDSPIYHFPNGDSNFVLPTTPGRYKITVSLPTLHLYPGQYPLKIALCNSHGSHFTILHIVDTLSVHILQDYKLCPRTLERQAGLIYADVGWFTKKLQN